MAAELVYVTALPYVWTLSLHPALRELGASGTAAPDNRGRDASNDYIVLVPAARRREVLAVLDAWAHNIRAATTAGGPL